MHNLTVVSLNTWGGERAGELFDYVHEHHRKVDIFCFQEVFHSKERSGYVEGEIGKRFVADLFHHLRRELPLHAGFFAPRENCWDYRGRTESHQEFGQAIFIRRSRWRLLEHGSFELLNYEDISGATFNNDGSIILQYALVKSGKERFLIGNIHGLRYEDRGKEDTDDRRKQSERILEFLKKADDRSGDILAGDFNLGINTKSLSDLEEWGFVNFVKEHAVPTTRSVHYPRKNEEPFADYILWRGAPFNISKQFNSSFSIDEAVVSDHLPLRLTVEKEERKALSMVDV